MADADTSVTTTKTTEDEAPEDPGMAAFLADKKAKEGSETSETTTKEEPAKEEEPASPPAKEEESEEEAEDEPKKPDESEAADDSPAKQEQNRLGYQLRQIRAGDPFVAQARRSLANDYVNAEGLTEDQREIRQMKADRYIEKLETSRAQLVSDNQQVAEEYPFFRPLNPDGTKNPEFNEQLYKRAIDRFGRDSLEMSEPDQDGKTEIVGYKVRLLDYMREEADLYLAGRGQSTSKTDPKKPDPKADPKDDKKTEAEMDAASEEPGGASTAKSEADAEEKDPIVKDFLAGFDSV